MNVTAARRLALATAALLLAWGSIISLLAQVVISSRHLQASVLPCSGPANLSLITALTVATMATRPGSLGPPLTASAIPMSHGRAARAHFPHGNKVCSAFLSCAITSGVAGNVAAGYGMVDAQCVFQLAARLNNDSPPRLMALARS